MSLKIERDQRRFKQIVRGKVRENLRKYISHGEMIGRKNKDLVSIPIPQLDVPRFRFGDNGNGGVGQGDGEEGTPVGKSKDGQPGGAGEAGSEAGNGHLMEVDMTIEELADILGDELELPNIEPKGNASLSQEKAKYNSIRSTGPEALRHKKRTYLKALRRQISTGSYELSEPNVTPIKNDQQYRSWNTISKPEVNAAVIYMMDVSGSMTDEQKQIVRTAAFWIDTWLTRQYGGLETRFIIHDAIAKEVDEHTFYHTRESGGTRISSAYRACAELLENALPPDEWNLYCFQFSDGDNWGEDNERAFSVLQEMILPHVNLYCYGQVESPYGSGEYLGHLEGRFGASFNTLITTEIEDKDAIHDAIQVFLGTGK